jgi:hypothetical protein
MNHSEFIKQSLKPVLAAIRSKQVLFSLHFNDEDNEHLKSSVDALSKLNKRIHDFVVKSELDVTSEELRNYTRSSIIPETEYFCFAPHVGIGYSPFMLYKDKDVVKGVFVKLRQHRFTFCSKTIKKLANDFYNRMFKEDTAISMKNALEHVRNRVDHENPDNVPLLEKVAIITFYVDLENQRILAKSSHRDQDGLASYFELLRRIAKFAEASGEGGITPLIDKALSERYYTTGFAQNALSSGLAGGAYNLSKMVEFFASKQDDDTESIVEPTLSAGFAYADNTKKTINFKNSIDLFLDGNFDQDTPHVSFEVLHDFAEQKSLIFNSLRVSGDIPIGALLTEYREEQAEQADEFLNGNYITLQFTTQAKDGNVCLQISDGLVYHKEAATRFLKDYFRDNACSRAQFENVMLERSGQVLEVLHDSISLFTKLYLTSSPTSQLSDDIGMLEDAIKATG